MSFHRQLKTGDVFASSSLGRTENQKILPVFYGFDIPMVACRNLLMFYRADYLYCRDRSLKIQKMNTGAGLHIKVRIWKLFFLFLK